MISLIFLLILVGCVKPPVDRYLENNHTSITMTNLNLDLELFTADLESAEIILAGQVHGVKANYAAKFGFMSALHQQAGFKYLLHEGGYGEAGWINQYLDSGDSSILDDFFDKLRGSAFWSVEGYKFWQDLYAYNQQQPEDERIVVVGIDIEQQFDIAVYYMNTLTGAENLEKLVLLEDALDDTENLADFIEEFKQHRLDNAELYIQALGDDLFHFDFVLNNLVKSVAYHEDGDFQVREQAMYENFIKLYDYLPVGKYFGQIGMEHVFQQQCSSRLEGVQRLAMSLTSEGSPVQGQVISVAYMYFSSKRTSPFDYSQVWVESLIHDSMEMQRLSNTIFTLFRLNGEDSPYDDKPLLIPGPHGGATTDYFQYVLTIGFSEGVTPYGPLN